jgi:probable selenate reductase FAD-binding subunit
MITDILRPLTARDAVRAKSAPGSAFLGGGTWLNSGRARGITTLISLERLGLDGIRADRDGCVIGAAVTLQQIVDSPHAPQALRAAAALTASRTLRNMRTIGGELGHCADDSAIIPVLMVLGAAVRVFHGVPWKANRRRPQPVEDYLAGKTGDLILSVSIPDTRRPCAVRVLSRTSHSPRSLVAAACMTVSDRALREIRVVISDCAGQRARVLEAAAGATELPSRERLEGLVAKAFLPKPDLYASASKRYLAGVLVADTVRALQEDRP